MYILQKIMFTILVVMLVGLMKAHDGLHDSDDVEHQRFEEINHDIFMSRVVGVNYTEETINGERIKYYITDTGDWHLGMFVLFVLCVILNILLYYVSIVNGYVWVLS